MINPSERPPQPPIPSLEEFLAAVRVNNTEGAHEKAILILEDYFDTRLAKHPEDWTPQGPHLMLRQRSTRAGEAGSVVQVTNASDAPREYHVSTYRTSRGLSSGRAGSWRKGDDRIMQIVLGAGERPFVMPSDALEATVMGAHPDTSEIIRPTGFRAFMRRLGILGVRALLEGQSRHPGMTRPFDS